MGAMVQGRVIITRPAPDGMRLADQLQAEGIPVIVSPLLRIVPMVAKTEAKGFVFTSTNGVVQAQRMDVARGPAWCVGERTAQAALNAGFEAVSANGNAEDLIEIVRTAAPRMPIAHIRGQHARGDIGPRLRHAGINCADVVAYTQEPLKLTAEAKTVIEGANPVIIPLFSPRTTALLFEQATPGPNARLIAISEQAAQGLDMRIARTPDGNAMFDAVLATIRALNT